MSWGVYWLFYQCPQCGKKFKSGADTITEPCLLYTSFLAKRPAVFQNK